jgi:D-aminoacyl-tRNA deacylase
VHMHRERSERIQGSSDGGKMKVLLVSLEDPASRNIRDRLIEEATWEKVGEFLGREILLNGDLLLFEKEGTHLYFENVDREISEHIRTELTEFHDPAGKYPLELLIFLSRHRSEMDIRSLTVHPPGNFLGADFGGDPGKLPPSAPIEMTAALRSLHKEKKALGLKDQTTFEVTHHGPLLGSPSFFIEIGSDENRWDIPELGRSIARALLSNNFRSPEITPPISIGIGGGHYAPRFTDRAMRKKFSFGHMIPDYILMNTDKIKPLIELAVRSTPGVEQAFLHISQKNEGILEMVPEILDELGLKIGN